MKDYLLTFQIATDMPTLDEMTRKLIAIAERTQSSLGGGCDNTQGEFYLSTSPRFTRTNLLEMIALVLPNSASLTVTTVARATHTHRRTQSLAHGKSSNGKTHRRTKTPAARARKVAVKS